eukprot:5922769-Amphidinium_carterae.1
MGMEIGGKGCSDRFTRPQKEPILTDLQTIKTKPIISFRGGSEGDQNRHNFGCGLPCFAKLYNVAERMTYDRVIIL